MLKLGHVTILKVCKLSEDVYVVTCKLHLGKENKIGGK
jgi:hypothetical protein